MIRLRIKCFLLKSWADLNRKRSGSILSHESIWINTWESTWVMSWFWLNSRQTLESWVESVQVCVLQSWADSNQFVGKAPDWKAPKKVIGTEHLSGKPTKRSTKSTVKLNAQKRSNETGNEWHQWVMSWFESSFWKFFLSRELIWIKIKDAFWVVSKYESNFRNPLWVVSWFESSLVNPLWFMSSVESKFSETELNWIR